MVSYFLDRGVNVYADGQLLTCDHHVVKPALFHADTHGLSEVVILSSSDDRCLPSVLSGFVCEGYRDLVGRGSSVGIATRYGLDGPEIESRWERDFFRTRPDRP